MARAAPKTAPRKKAVAEAQPKREAPKRRTYLSQTDVPSCGLEQALRLAQAIADSYGKQPTRPLLVADAMKVAPNAGYFRSLCGASIAYGLTVGGYNAKVIELTPLGRRIVSPTVERDDEAGKREAVLRPRVLREFLTRYNGSVFPAERIARNVLEELGVPGDRTTKTYKLIRDSAQAVGFLRNIKGKTYVDLESDVQDEPAQTSDGPSADHDDDTRGDTRPTNNTEVHVSPDRARKRKKSGRVFITHGSDRQVVAQLKELLTFGGFTPVVALEQETVSKPVPDKVLDDMRSCGAAIIHVGAGRRVLDEEGGQRHMLNQNVLIEIGARRWPCTAGVSFS